MIKRREVLKAGGGLALAGTTALGAGKPLRIGFVGVGARGTGLLELLLQLGGIDVPAIADVDESHVRRAQSIVEKHGQPRPEGYSRSEADFRRLCDRSDLH